MRNRQRRNDLPLGAHEKRERNLPFSLLTLYVMFFALFGQPFKIPVQSLSGVPVIGITVDFHVDPFPVESEQILPPDDGNYLGVRYRQQPCLDFFQ